MMEITHFLSSVESNKLKYGLGLTHVQHPTKAEFISELQLNGNKELLFPDNYITVMWEPYQLMASNLSYIYEESHVIWSKQKCARSSADHAHTVSLLTCVTVIPCEAGLRLDMAIFGQDQTSLASHVWTALHHVRTTYPDYDGSVQIVLYYPEHIVLQKSDFFAGNIPWRRGAWSRYESYILGRVHRKTDTEDELKSML